MAVTGFLYGNAFKNGFSGLSFTADDIRVALVTSAYTPDQDVHQNWSDVVANEVAGTGYTANGLALTTKAVTYTGATNVTKFAADNAAWAASTITARYAVIYDRTPATDATRYLLGYVDFGANVVSTNGAFTITWNASGIFTVTVS